MDAKSLPTLNELVNRLMTQIAAKQVELDRRERSCGKFHDLKKMNRLREEIAKLETKLQRAEILQDQALRA